MIMDVSYEHASLSYDHRTRFVMQGKRACPTSIVGDAVLGTSYGDEKPMLTEYFSWAPNMFDVQTTCPRIIPVCAKKTLVALVIP